MVDHSTDKTDAFEEFQRLAESSAWWKEVFGEFSRAINNGPVAYELPPEQILELSSVMLELTSIREADLQRARGDEVFKEARAIIERLSAGDPFPDRLSELFELRRREALARIEEQGFKLVSLLTDESVRSRVRDLWNNNRAELPRLTGKLPDRFQVRGLNQRHILHSICELAQIEQWLIARHTYPFSSETYMPATFGNQGERDRIDYLAYRVYDPLWNDLMERFDIEYVTFPLRWAGAVLPVALMRRLQDSHKTGKDILADLLDHYRQEEQLEILRERIANCPHTSAFSDLFDEVTEDFQDGRYRACSLALLSLTEGLLWAFARLYAKLHGGIFDHAVSDDDFKDLNFRLVRRDGRLIEKQPNIGGLLRYTAFGDAISYEFVEYYCEELFKERNPVLHGREPDYGDGKKAAILLFLVNVIERRILTSVKDFTRHLVLKTLKENRKSKKA
jgi:hypothetical protein